MFFIPVCHRWGIGSKLAKERGVNIQVDILNSIWFTLDFCTRLYPLDNTHQGIYTKKDCLPFIINNKIVIYGK